MKVSVIVPTFNRAHMLKETLGSILQQTHRDLEVIVIDNCSVDNTESTVKSYNDDRIRYFKHQNNGIIAINMNYGMRRAQGNYIAFCDDDDLWNPNKLEKQLAEFEKDDRVALVCTNGIDFNETGKGKISIKSHLCDSDFTLKSLLLDNAIINSSILVKKSVIDEVGMMDEEPEIFGAEEYSLWIRIAEKYKIKYINLPLVKYRTHPGAYRRNETESLNVQKQIFKKLLKNKIIDNKLYKMAFNRLNYKYLITKLVNEGALNLETIFQNKMNVSDKFRLIILYFLFRMRMFNTIRHIRHNILHVNVNIGER